MVAVISGNGLGVKNTSASSLGSQGTVGSASGGNSSEQVYVNSATGNLVIQDTDDYLAALGLNLPVVRTYNSQAQMNNDFGGNWRLGVNEQLINLTGTVNTAGSTITKVFGDESEVVYAYNTTTGQYVAVGQSGAAYTLKYNASTQVWTWTQGSPQNTETYSSAGQLLTASDTNGNPRSYHYNGSQLTSIADASGQTVTFQYNSNGTLANIKVSSNGQSETHTYYSYDSQNRLQTVTVDLSPQDNSITDGKVYTTTYAYDGTSNRINSISQSDGTAVSFTYVNVGGTYRIATYTQSDQGITTASANMATLSTSITTTSTATYNLNTSAVTPPHWATSESPFAPGLAGTNSGSPSQTEFAANGNGFAVWQQANNSSQTDARIYVSQYTASSGTWGAPQLLADVSGSPNIGNYSLAVDSQGNAIVAWDTLSANASKSTIFASIYTAGSGWVTQQARGPIDRADGITASINGGHAAISYGREFDNVNYFGSALLAIEYANGSWGGPHLLDSVNLNASGVGGQMAQALDSQGNLNILWTRYDSPTDTITLYRGQLTAAGSWSGGTLEQTFSGSTPGQAVAPGYITGLQFEVDQNGNGFAIWKYGNWGGILNNTTTIMMDRFTSSTNTWSGVSTLIPNNGISDNTAPEANPIVASDWSGNVYVAYNGPSGSFGRQYSAATGSWGGIATLPTQSNNYPSAGVNAVAINGSTVAISFDLYIYNNTVPQLYAVTSTNGVWGTPTALTPGLNSLGQQVAYPYNPSVVVHPSGSADEIFGDGLPSQLVISHYTNQYSYTVPAGASWASIGQAVYGSANVAAQLQSILGSPTLNPGLILSGFPPSITVTTTTTTTVPAYYLVPSGATWASVTQAIYGTSDANAIAALQSALNHPTLTAGGQLTVPLTLNFLAAATGRVTQLSYTLPAGTAATATANSASLISSQQQTTTSTVNLATGNLTTPTAGWGSASTFASSVGAYPNASFNTSGTGISAWFQNGSVYVSQYSQITKTWSPAALVAAAANEPSTESEPALSIDSQGNVVVAWVHSDSTQDTVYAAYYSATSGWSAPQVLAATTNRVTPLLNGSNEVQVSISGGVGAVAWVAADGAGGNSVYAAQFSSGIFGAAQNLGATDPVAPSPTTNAVEAPTVGVSNGAVVVAWRTGIYGAAGTYVNQFNTSTGSWGAAKKLTSLVGATGNQLQFGGNSSTAILVFDFGSNGVFALTYNFTTQKIGALQALSAAGTKLQDLSVQTDSQGNVLASWIGQASGVTSLGAREFNAAMGTWKSAVETIPATVPAGSILLSNVFSSTYSGGTGAVAFEALNPSTGTANLYVSNLSGGVWSNPTPVATASTPFASPGLGIDANNNIALFYSNGATLMSNAYAVDTTPYYKVAATDTWSTIATKLYGTSNAAAALQAALNNPALIAGEQLEHLPNQLTYTSTSTVAVTPYYLVTGTDTWASIAQTVYGTSDAGAISALQSALLSPNLTAGLHLAVPQTLNYTQAIPAGSLALQTVITAPMGGATTLYQDANGRLIESTTPAANGSLEVTKYSYDSNGNVTSVTQNPNGIQRQTVFEYDSNGNRILERNADGNTTISNYSSADQLLSRTQYLMPDPSGTDGANIGQPSNPLTTYYVYDGNSNLRFVVSPSGNVTEYRYSSQGERTAQLQYTNNTYPLTGLNPNSTLALSTMVAWLGGLTSAPAQRTDYTYDFRGQLSTATTYQQVNPSTQVGVTTAQSVTQYVYDQWGRLLKKITPRGAGSSDSQANSIVYTYDGLNRVLTTTAWVSSQVSGSTTTDVTETTATQYADASNQIITTAANGLVTVKTYDKAGELTSVVESNSSGQTLESTSYAYDQNGHLRMLTDALGNRSYILYDGSGNKVADITADGALTQYIYSGANELVETVQYTEALSSTTLATLVDSSGKPANVSVSTLVASLPLISGTTNPLSVANITHKVYDTAGQLVYRIDASGAVTQYIYDGAGRVTDQIEYGTAIQVNPNANATTTAAIAALITPSSTDRHTRYFYDANGRLQGTLDPAGDLVGYTYDDTGNLLIQTSYGATAASLWTGGTFAQLQGSASSGTRLVESYTYYANGQKASFTDADGYVTTYSYDLDGNLSSETRAATSSAPGTPTSTEANQTTSFQYDGLGELTQKTNYEGTVDQYSYDAAGDLISSTVASGTSDARPTDTQYDALGRVTAQLTAQGVALLPSATTQAQINAIWAQYSVRYTYDLAGNKTSQTDQNGNTTLYFYDVDGRLRFTVDALGEVAESRYNILGELTDSIRYANRIATATLAGGLVNSVLQNEVAAAANPAQDSHLTYTYTSDRQIQTITTADGEVTTKTYNAFGDVRLLTQTLGSSQSVTTAYSYDARGLLLSRQSDTNGLNITDSRTYDAFGRLTSQTDGNGNATRYVYDNLGRVTQTIDPLGGSTKTGYDSFGRVLSTADANGNTTSSTYNDGTLTETTTDPNGNVTTTVHNREGQQSSVTAAGNTTSYVYDANGNLKTVSDALGTLDSITYDAAGRKLTDTNAVGTTTTYKYDNANRLYTQTVDSAAGGLNLITTYVYDGEGRVTQIVEPNGRVTTKKYDGDGNLLQVVVDPLGLNLATNYTYDLLGHVLTETQGAGSSNPLITQYFYDDLGRKIEQIVDPIALGGKLNLTTFYRYDAAGNLTREINASGNSTWYVYDADNRARYTIDALGGVTENRYDADGRVISTRRYATPISTSGLGNVVQSISVTASPGVDNFQQTIYDGDGNAIYIINAVGAVTHFAYDARGNVTFQQSFSNKIAYGTYTTASAVTIALTQAGSNVSAIGPKDEVSYTTYDQRGNAVFSINGAGTVTQKTYDGAGNVTSVTQFATLYPSGGATDLTHLTNWASSNASNAQNRTTRYWYDSTGRLRFELDSGGYLTETQYNDAARTHTVLAYFFQPTIAAGANLAAVSAAAALISSFPEKTTTTYDVAGRVSSIVDANGNTQSFKYDQLGNKISYTNQNGATWTYQYDADHHLLVETAPAVSVTRVTGSGGVNNTLSASTTTGVQPQTVYTYDAMGNVKTQTQAANTSQAATITYSYDALGRQIGVTYPSVGVYNFAGDNPNNTGTAVARVETTGSLTTATRYDTLGNAYSDQDVSGNYTYKVYDAAGEVLYQVDANNYVTAFTYDAFGNQLTETRYANALTSLMPSLAPDTTSYVANDVLSRLNANANADRTITTTYDILNRVVSVVQPVVYNFDTGTETAFSGSPTTLTQYDAFGDVILTQQLVSTNTFANTYYYYDQRGLKTAEIDRLGYITTYKYDAYKNLTDENQYAKALAAGSWNTATHAAPTATTISTSFNDPAGYDRETSYAYDALNRKTSESLLNFQYYSISQGVLTRQSGNQTTSYGYDGVGNVTSVTNAAGTTYTYYDALGRVIAVASPRRNIDGTIVNGIAGDVEVTPLTQMYRDALGNLVEQVQYANDAGSIPPLTTTPPTVAASSNDRMTIMLVDALGRVLQTQDPTGAESFASYDARGDVAKEWQYVSSPDGTVQAIAKIHKYDNLGNQILLLEPENISGVGSAITVIATQTVYDAFGELTAQGTYSYSGPSALQSTYEYDQDGRLWRTNFGNGVEKIYLYNLADKATVELTSQSVDLSANNSALSSANVMADSAAANSLGGTMRAETTYDIEGRVTGQRAPQFTIADSESLIDAQPTISNLATTVPPGAVYQQILIYDSALYTDAPTGAYYVVNPSAISNGGGYVQLQPPSAQYPNGLYQQVSAAQYQLIQGQVLHWAAPSDSQVSATITYWPVSNPSNVSVATPQLVSDGQIGISLQGLANGNYGYTISYTNAGASSAFATQSGTFSVAGTASAVTVASRASLASVSVTPTTTQTLDRWGNVLSVTDASGNVTQYLYNQANKLTLTILPSETTVQTSPTIQVTTILPRVSNFYDQQGNLISTIDGDGTGPLSTYNSAGQLLTTKDGSGALTEYVYNVFGDRIQVTDPMGYLTRNIYDADNRLVTTAQELTLTNSFANTGSPAGQIAPDLSVPASYDLPNIIVQSYLYDSAGRRIESIDGDGHVTKDWYDSNGDVIQSQTPLGFDTDYQYDIFGKKVRETDANGSFRTWTYNAFGQLQNSTDLANNSSLGYLYGAFGGTAYTYRYDGAGDLLSQTSTAGQNEQFVYDAAGHLTSATDAGVAASGSGLANSSSTTTYAYDTSGRQIRETVVVNGFTMKDTRTGYDVQNRIATLDDPNYQLTYYYDGAGNRTEIIASYLGHNGLVGAQTLFYTYDADNRVLISGGIEQGTTLPFVAVQSWQGTQLTYDARGDRISAETAGNDYYYDLAAGTVRLGPGPNGLSTQHYQYDGAGRLISVSRDSGNSGIAPTVESNRTYNKEGQLTYEYNTFIQSNNNVMNYHTINTTYDADGRPQVQVTDQLNIQQSVVTYGEAQLQNINGVEQWSSGYDPAGILRGFQVEVDDGNGVAQYVTTHNLTYLLGSTYQQTGETASSVKSASNTGTLVPTDGSTSYAYNVNGALVQFTDNKQATSDRYFANDINGDVLTVIQGNFDGQNGDMTVAQAWQSAVGHTSGNAAQVQYYFFADGKNVGTFGQLQDGNGNFVANFDVNYTPVSQTYPASTPAQVVVQTGDTLRIIAQRVFGDGSLWYLIADENGLTTNPDTTLTQVGMVLKIPNSVATLHNNYSSFKPFNPSQALGDTTPTQPEPPPPAQGSGGGGGCGVFGEILMIVVAIVVTYVTEGAASEEAGSLIGSVFGESAADSAVGTLAANAVGAAAAAAAGSVASQGVGIAIGQQQGFSWQQVGVAALTAGLTQGTPVADVDGSVAGYAALGVQGAINSVVTQGTEVALGLQHGFSWSNVALAAVEAPLSAAAGNAVGQGAEGYVPTQVGQFFSGFASGLTNVAVRIAAGGKVSVDSAIGDAFQNALGNSLQQTEESPEVGTLTPEQQADVQAGINASTQAAIDATSAEIQINLDTEQSIATVNQQVAADNQSYFNDTQNEYNSHYKVSADLHNAAYDIGYALQDNPNQGFPSVQSLQNRIANLQAPQVAFPSDTTTTAADTTTLDPNTFWGDHLLRQQLSAQGLSADQIEERLAATGGRGATTIDQQSPTLIENILSNGGGSPPGPSIGPIDYAGQARWREQQNIFGAIAGGPIIGGTYFAARAVGFDDNSASQFAQGVAGFVVGPRLTSAEPGIVTPELLALDVPQGLSSEQFADFSQRLRSVLDAEALPAGQTFIHGSRAAGTATPGSSDIDVLHVVSDADFDALVNKRLAETSGRNQELIQDYATNQQRITARGISRTFESNLWENVYPSLPSNEVTKIQFSIVKASSPFNSGPFVPVPK